MEEFPQPEVAVCREDAFEQCDMAMLAYPVWVTQLSVLKLYIATGACIYCPVMGKNLRKSWCSGEITTVVIGLGWLFCFVELLKKSLFELLQEYDINIIRFWNSSSDYFDYGTLNAVISIQ